LDPGAGELTLDAGGEGGKSGGNGVERVPRIFGSISMNRNINKRYRFNLKTFKKLFSRPFTVQNS
jgi:hypothetical protein